MAEIPYTQAQKLTFPHANPKPTTDFVLRNMLGSLEKDDLPGMLQFWNEGSETTETVVSIELLQQRMAHLEPVGLLRLLILACFQVLSLAGTKS